MTTTLEFGIMPGTIPDLTPEAELAVLARALWRSGYNDHDAGHLTYRQPDETFLAIPWEIGWNELTASDVIRIDIDGNKVDGRWSVPPAIGLHLEYHRAHPGVNVTIHQHPQYSTIWSTAGRLPAVYDQRSATLPDSDYVLYDDFAGILETGDTVKAAVDAIGEAKCALLRNHGVFVVGDNMPQAYTNAVTLEWRCKMAWHCEVLGSTGTVPDYGRKSIEDTIRSRGGYAPGMWEWAVRRELGPAGSVLA